MHGEKLWTEDLAVLWRNVQWLDMTPASLPVNNIPRANAWTRMLLLFLFAYCILSYINQESMYSEVFCVVIFLILAGTLRVSATPPPPPVVHQGHLVTNLSDGANQNPYNNPLVGDAPGGIVMAPPTFEFDDGLHRMSLYGTSIANPRHTFHQAPDPNQMGRPPVRRCLYGSYAAEGERGNARGGLWM